MDARTIESNAELQSIAHSGAGLVIDPAARRWHLATCQHLPLMTVGAPKWFAATREALDSYCARRAAQSLTAKPIQACPTCDPESTSAKRAARSLSAAGRIPTPSTDSSSPATRAPCLRRADDGFEIWADEYVRNESTAASAAGALRQLISGEIRRLPPPDGRLLHAAYAGYRWPGTDVENLLFNNIDQTLKLFANSGNDGVRFEDLGDASPAAPDGTTRSSSYAYRLVEAGEAFHAAETRELACRTEEAVVPEGPARLAARIWLAVRRARPSECRYVATAPYVLRVTTRGLPPATNVKAIVDGASAAMQQGVLTDPLRQSIGRLAALLDADEDDLLSLVTGPEAPLGVATGLFTLDGSAQVRVTPDDDRCVAAEVMSAGHDGPPRIGVAVHVAHATR